MTTNLTIQKPKKVSLAINLLFLSIALGVINSVISELTTELRNYSSLRGLLITVVTFGSTTFFVYQMKQGKKWARTTFLVLFLLGALLFPFTLIAIFKANQLAGFLTVILTVIQIVALTLLYNKESNEWFNSGKQMIVNQMD